MSKSAESKNDMSGLVGPVFVLRSEREPIHSAVFGPNLDLDWGEELAEVLGKWTYARDTQSSWTKLKKGALDEEVETIEWEEKSENRKLDGVEDAMEEGVQQKDGELEIRKVGLNRECKGRYDEDSETLDGEILSVVDREKKDDEKWSMRLVYVGGQKGSLSVYMSVIWRRVAHCPNAHQKTILQIRDLGINRGDGSRDCLAQLITQSRDGYVTLWSLSLRTWELHRIREIYTGFGFFCKVALLPSIELIVSPTFDSGLLTAFCLGEQRPSGGSHILFNFGFDQEKLGMCMALKLLHLDVKWGSNEQEKQANKREFVHLIGMFENGQMHVWRLQKQSERDKKEPGAIPSVEGRRGESESKCHLFPDPSPEFYYSPSNLERSESLEVAICWRDSTSSCHQEAENLCLASEPEYLMNAEMSQKPILCMDIVYTCIYDWKLHVMQKDQIARWKIQANEIGQIATQRGDAPLSELEQVSQFFPDRMPLFHVLVIGICGGADDRLVLFAIDWFAKKIHILETHQLDSSGIQDIKIHPEFNSFVTAGWDHLVRVFSICKKNLVFKLQSLLRKQYIRQEHFFNNDTQCIIQQISTLHYHKESVQAVDLVPLPHSSSSNHASLLSAALDHKIALYSIF